LSKNEEKYEDKKIFLGFLLRIALSGKIRNEKKVRHKKNRNKKTKIENK